MEAVGVGRGIPGRAETSTPGNTQAGFPLRATSHASEFLEISPSVVPLSICWMSSFFFFLSFFIQILCSVIPLRIMLAFGRQRAGWVNTDHSEVKPEGLQRALCTSVCSSESPSFLSYPRKRPVMHKPWHPAGWRWLCSLLAGGGRGLEDHALLFAVCKPIARCLGSVLKEQIALI